VIDKNGFDSLREPDTSCFPHDAAPSPETDENQPKRFAQHIGPPCHGVSNLDVKELNNFKYCNPAHRAGLTN
jgi:hypothetical protein